MKAKLSLADAFHIALGGTLGSLLRWWIGLGFAGTFPFPTLFANLLGSVALGVLYAIQHRMHPHGKYLFMIGFCGSFTTVSSFFLETLELWQGGHQWLGLLNVSVSVAGALLLVACVIPLVERAERSPGR